MSATEITAEIHNWDHFTIGGKTKVAGYIQKDRLGRFPENYWVTTSTVKSVAGDIITTRSGSVYKLVNQREGSTPIVLETADA